MELIPWRPLSELGSFRRDMDRLWNRFFDEKPFSDLRTEQWTPSVDISENQDNFIVKTELPGMDTKDVKVSISGDLLTIKGEKKREKEENDEHLYCCERYSGFFQRVFQLPTAVKGDKVEATFEKGVLKITLPKIEEAKKKDIEIKVN
jgi:HSP20 family protein